MHDSPLRAVFLLTTFLATLPALGETTPQELLVLNERRASSHEQTLAATLQGQLAKQGVLVWRRERVEMNQVYLDRFRKQGVTTRPVSDVWELLKQHKDKIKGYVQYSTSDGSINAATSLCGLLGAVAVEQSLVDEAQRLGLKQVADARGKDEADVLAEHPDAFAKELVVVLDERIGRYLRDWAVSEGAFCFHGFSSQQRQATLRKIGPSPVVYGWEGEREFVSDVSAAGGMVVPADYCLNLSVLARMPIEFKRKPVAKPKPVKKGERIVAFVMTDGDNLQFMSRGFGTSRAFWASPHRGKFAMSWEVPPLAAEVAPQVMNFLYDTATPNDGFIAGPSGGAYIFPYNHPDLAKFSKRTGELMTKCQLSVSTAINPEGGMEDAKPLVEPPEVAGVLYKGWYYASEKGRVLWHNGKPIASYRYMMWDPKPTMGPEALAKAIAAQPADPANDPDSYALVNVHAWSFGQMGGPMEAINRCVEKLPPGTRVVTADEYITLLRDNFGGAHRSGQ